MCVPHQVSISEADLQAMGGTITMVTQEGTTITIPAHELATQGAHSVTMVTADGSDEQVSNKQQLLTVDTSGLVKCLNHHYLVPLLLLDAGIGLKK